MTKPTIATYTISCDDDTDVLVNCARSAARLGPHLIFDSGPFFCQHPRPRPESLHAFAERMNREEGCRIEVQTVPWSEEEGGYARLRNIAGYVLRSYDWVIGIDSDEMLSEELIEDLPGLLEACSPTITAIRTPLLTPVPDEAHYSTRYSQMLSHARIYRPTAITWVNPWHEHQNYTGIRVDWPGHYHIHLRQLFSERCQRQRGHGWQAWQGIEESIKPITELAFPVTWAPIAYPEEDCGHRN